MKKRFYIIIALIVFTGLIGCKTTPLEEEGGLVKSEICRGESDFDSLEDAKKWLFKIPGEELELRFQGNVMIAKYTCERSSNGNTYSNSKDASYPFLNKFNSNIDLQSTRILDPYISQLDEYCIWTLTQELSYSFSGSCLKLRDENNKVFYFEAQK